MAGGRLEVDSKMTGGDWAQMWMMVAA